MPLNKANRRVVHELANRFSVKSLSRGSGDQRHPVLTKTSRTRPFKEEVFNALEGRFIRRFFPRVDRSIATHGTKKKERRGPIASTAYRDGEVVGASAPELGSENRGRNMLEKMGWSSGTALGAANNKGSLQPVLHTVKNTRSGLG